MKFSVFGVPHLYPPRRWGRNLVGSCR